MGTKSVTIAYILWFFLGWLGVHQFYLRRDRHAFFTWATLGGVVGIGWLRDLFYIPTYVADTNETSEYMERLVEEMSSQGKPRQGFCRWAACLALGYIFALLAYTALWKEDLHERYMIALAVLAHALAGLGVCIVSGEGRQKVSLKWCVLGSWLALPLTIMYGPDSVWYAPLASSSVAGYKVEWRRQPRRSGLCKRVSCLTLAGIIYLGVVTVTVYDNATITSKGETVPLKEAIKNFFTSPAWRETKETFTQLFNYYKHHGWRAIWEEIVSSFDPQGEAHAYEVLGVSSSASQKDIKSAYKNLALKYHPDKEKDPEKKEEVANKFMEIQKAYDTLSNLKQSRTKKSEL